MVYTVVLALGKFFFIDFLFYKLRFYIFISVLIYKLGYLLPTRPMTSKTAATITTRLKPPRPSLYHQRQPPLSPRKMPTTPRKSSVGGPSRRGSLKAHMPYRGDNPEVGKKTGIAVQHVTRQSDGFEPFDQNLQQADGRTPPRPKGTRTTMVRMMVGKSPCNWSVCIVLPLVFSYLTIVYRSYTESG